MITEKGKAFIARNFGVSNCYALDDVVSCTVYTKGTPSERVLDTPTIVFLLVTDIVDWVRTSTGRFTLGDLVAANEGKYISMTEALDITAYCIPEGPIVPPVTPPVIPPVEPVVPIVPIVPLVVPPGGVDYELVSPSVSCDRYNCTINIRIKNNTSRSGSVYMRVDIDAGKRFKRYVYIIAGTTKAQSAVVPLMGLKDGYHDLTIAVGKTTDTDTYTQSVLVGDPSIVPPITPLPPIVPPITPVVKPSLSSSEFIAEIRKRGTIDLARISRVPGDSKWFLFAGQLVYRMPGGKGGIAITNAGKHNMYAAFSKDERTVSRVEWNWAMARIGELPFTTAAAPTVKITKEGLITELRGRGAIDLAAVSTVPAKNKWSMYRGRLSYEDSTSAISIRNLSTRNPPTRTSDISLEVNEIVVSEIDKSWILARIGELPYAAAPPVTALPAPTNIRVTHLSSDSAYVEWNGVLECCSDPGKPREYCACEFGITLNGVSKGKVFSDPHPGFDCEELTPGTRYTLEIQTRSPPNIYEYREPSEKVSVTFTTPAAPVTPPITPLPPIVPPITPVVKPSLSSSELIAEIRKRGTLDLARISRVPGDNKWFRFAGQLVYRLSGGKGGIAIVNVGKSNMYAAFSKDGRTVSRVERAWGMARIGELPFTTAAAPTVKITKEGLITELRSKGAIDTGGISKFVGHNKWYMHRSGLYYKSPSTRNEIAIQNLSTRNPPTRAMDISMAKGEGEVNELDRSWVLARLAELPYTTAAPPVTPPITPPVTSVPEAIKAWIVANYGDGTRVTSDGGRKLNVAKMANMLAALPSGYTKADITEAVVLWAMDNPNWESATICTWIEETGVTRLTEDHGLYIYNSAVGWTTLANRIYGTLSPKPSKPSAGIVTEDNGLGVYDYAIGWKTIANRITRCNF